MSAQAGIWNFNGKPVDQFVLERLGSAIGQYGPDGGNDYVNGSIAMLYRAFHTTPESRREHQPYVSARGNVITWDGRLDNREELIPLLHHDLAGDRTDIAIVATAFDQWGNDCFHHFVGDWAVSIWKPGERELMFAADYMAIRHIFYYLKDDHVWWSTALSPLVLLSSEKLRVDDEYIAGYLAHDPDAHLTPYREIREVPPGHFVRVRSGRDIVANRYWSFDSKSHIRHENDAEYEEEFRCLFRQAVRRRLRGDRPVLAELSGGLDSSSIVCMADDILANEGAYTPCLDTLSYYDNTEPSGDDWLYFQKVEEKRGRTGIHIDASKLGSSPASFGYPDFAPLPGYFGAARQLDTQRADVIRRGGYRVVLSGIGGDEFLGGIPDPRDQLADLILQFKLVNLGKQLMAWSLVKRRPCIQLLVLASSELLPTSLRQYLAKEAKVEPWIEKKFAKRTRIAMRLLRPIEGFGLCLPTRRSYIAGVIAMANKMAKWTAQPLELEEVRFPYLDQNLIEFACSVPASQLLRPGERRSLMRRSLAGILPLEILSRRTKQSGARTPVVVLEKCWKQLHAALSSALIARFGYINQHRFLEKLRRAKNGEEIHVVRMLRTISLEFWLRDLTARGLLHNPKEHQRHQVTGSTYEKHDCSQPTTSRHLG